MSEPRVVWITGASSGIGRSLAQEFVTKGDTVVATARTAAALQSFQDEFPSYRDRLLVHACDVREESQVQGACEEILSRFAAIDILINSAGVTYFKDFMSTSITEFDEVVATNLRGPFLTSKAVLPGMIERGRGTIMNIISYAGKVVYTGSSAYAASKAGAEALMNVIRAETRDKGIKIVNINPGAVLTPIWKPKHRERYGHRMMKPEEIARIVYEISCQPPSMMIEDVVIRPQGGDLKV
jgi:NADP-dependent 3-hydroxy acid dehydrogenase YdfG